MEEYDEPCLFLENRHEVICLLMGLREVQQKCHSQRDPSFQPRPGRVDVNVARLQTSDTLIEELETILEKFYPKAL